ncbi:hypothetical protein [Acidovorax temperans]|uniref:hypothetical protein n=1 Tax=Acidovorax temperans TaxID=80878 RepID=UPI0030D00CB3
MPRLVQLQGADAPAARKVARTWCKPGTKQGAGATTSWTGGAGSDMAVFFGAVQHMGIKLRASTAADAAPGQQEVVLRHKLSGEEDILRSVEWLQVGGQAYRLELQGLAAGDAYQALAGYVVQADAQELVLVGLPGF